MHNAQKPTNLQQSGGTCTSITSLKGLGNNYLHKMTKQYPHNASSFPILLSFYIDMTLFWPHIGEFLCVIQLYCPPLDASIKWWNSRWMRWRGTLKKLVGNFIHINWNTILSEIYHLSRDKGNSILILTSLVFLFSVDYDRIDRLKKSFRLVWVLFTHLKRSKLLASMSW